MRGRGIALVVMALMMAFVLGACGGSNDGGNQGVGGNEGGNAGGEQASGNGGGGGPSDKTMQLTVPKMERVKDTPVYNAAYNDEQKLRQSTIHLNQTGFPWDEEANVYIAGHRLGYPNTGSFLIFYDIDRLEKGDEITLTDSEGTKYNYKVFNKEVVEPTQVEVIEPMDGKNIVTLQACTLPDYSKRIIVQGELQS